MSDTIGTLIIDRIIAGKLLHATCAHEPDHECLVVWSAGAVEQLDALVSEHSDQLVCKSAIIESFADAVHANQDHIEARADRLLAENVSLRARVAELEHLLKTAKEQIYAMEAISTADLARWGQLESVVELIDDEPTGFFISCDDFPDEPDVWICFTKFLDARRAAIDAARKGQP